VRRFFQSYNESKFYGQELNCWILNHVKWQDEGNDGSGVRKEKLHLDHWWAPRKYVCGLDEGGT
jgi:hypothetical protein